MRRAPILLLMAAVFVAGCTDDDGVAIETAHVDRGEVVETVAAPARIEPAARATVTATLRGRAAEPLADEPTGNLDSRTGEDIMALLEQLQAERGTALVVITHEADIAARAQRTIELHDGVIVGGGS